MGVGCAGGCEVTVLQRQHSLSKTKESKNGKSVFSPYHFFFFADLDSAKLFFKKISTVYFTIHLFKLLNGTKKRGKKNYTNSPKVARSIVWACFHRHQLPSHFPSLYNTHST